MQIVPVNAILPERNNRLDFSHVPGLAGSIVSAGLRQAIEIFPIQPEDPRYKQPVNFSFTLQGETKTIILYPEFSLIAGESRWRAHIWAGLDSIKAEVSTTTTTEKEAMLGTVLENTARKGLTIIEESEGFNRLLSLGCTLQEISKYSGQKVDYIEKRVNLKHLTLEYSEMAHKGQLTIEYAAALSTLKPEYQYQAVTELVSAGDKANIQWFRKVCGRLLEKQNSFSLFDLALFGGGPTSANSPQNATEDKNSITADSINLAVNPATYTPNFASGRKFDEVLQDAIATLERSRLIWAEYEHQDKVMLCDNLITQYSIILQNLPEVKESPENKITRLLNERGEMTKRELAQFGNMAVNDVVASLAKLDIKERKQGKKMLYSLNC